MPDDGVPLLQSLPVLQSPEMPFCHAVVLTSGILVSLGRMPLSGGKLGGPRLAERTHPENLFRTLVLRFRTFEAASKAALGPD
jgi:hypothetical protein